MNGFDWFYPDGHLAHDVSDDDADGGGDHGHGYAMQQSVHVATGQINHNIALIEGGQVLSGQFRNGCLPRPQGG